MGTTSPPADRPLRVLLVDDDEDDFVLTRELLGDIPGGQFVLDHAPTYEAGLEAVCAGGHDVYLLDYLLGARTGIDLLTEAHGRGCRAPVILLTGNQDRRDVIAGLESGADDYITKPCDWEELRARLLIGRRIVSLQQALASRVRELQTALADVRRLSGLLPICAYCKRIRDDQDYWKQIEQYVSEHTDAQFSHGICPECLETHLPASAR